MPQTISNLTITADAWVDISDVSGIPVGTAYTITNEKGNWVLLYESSTEPALGETSGRRISVFPNSTYHATIPSGSLKIWAKMLEDRVITASQINVQEV